LKHDEVCATSNMIKLVPLQTWQSIYF